MTKKSKIPTPEINIGDSKWNEANKLDAWAIYEFAVLDQVVYLSGWLVVYCSYTQTNLSF